MFAVRPAVPTGAGAGHGDLGGLNSRPSVPVGHEGGARPVPISTARRVDGGRGRFRGRGSLSPRPWATLGHEGGVRLGHRGAQAGVVGGRT